MSATCCLFLSLLGQNIFRPIGDKAARMLKTVKKSTKMFLFLFF